ncbi:MAG: hypothetical protein K8R48_06340 [Alphaproteobacteria bacterium]|nr:hypothetical protein [Alphaproteobacteria bacterium]
MKNLLKDEPYIFTSISSNEPEDRLPADILGDIFKRYALKEGFKLSVTRCFNQAAIAEFKVGEDVPFATMQGIMNAISARAQMALFISPEKNFAGQNIFSVQNPSEEVQKEHFLKSGYPSL